MGCIQEDFISCGSWESKKLGALNVRILQHARAARKSQAIVARNQQQI